MDGPPVAKATACPDKTTFLPGQGAKNTMDVFFARNA
jgi:hypothetical protein